MSRSVTEILQLYAVRTVTSSYTAVFSLTVPQVSVAGYIQVSIFLVFKKVIVGFVVKSHVNLERSQDPKEEKTKGIKTIRWLGSQWVRQCDLCGVVDS